MTTSLPARYRRLLAAGALTTGVACAIAGCGGHASTAGAARSTTAPTTSDSPATASPPNTAPGTTLSAADVADSGLPSRVGSGKLSKRVVEQLVQYFEDKVARAYATGDADALDHYLAGPMLSGNRATISLLQRQGKLNVFRIHVTSVSPQTNEANHVIVNMSGDMELDYFVNTKTRKVLDHGLPGPSQVQFVIFLDRNPATHTWYWTGEQAANSGSTSDGNPDTTVLGTG